jgi:hypothetical protein
MTNLVFIRGKLYKEVVDYNAKVSEKLAISEFMLKLFMAWY